MRERESGEVKRRSLCKDDEQDKERVGGGVRTREERRRSGRE